MTVKLPGPEADNVVETETLGRLDIAYCASCGYPVALYDHTLADAPTLVHPECAVDYKESINQEAAADEQG